MKTTILEIAKQQNIELSEKELNDLEKINEIILSNFFLHRRLSEFEKNGFYVFTAPSSNGFGVGTCLKRMASGALRVRVSAAWGGSKFGTYAKVIHI